MRSPKSAAFLLVVALTVGLTACSPDHSPAPTASETSPHYRGSVSLAVSYNSVEQVKAASTLTVRGIALTSHVEMLSDMPFTVTDLTVTGCDDLALVGTHIAVRQTGSTDYLFEGVTRLLEPGHDYLLMLSPFQLDPAGPQVGGQYVITGEQGGWEMTADGADPIFLGNPDLAKPLTTDDVADLLQQT